MKGILLTNTVSLEKVVLLTNEGRPPILYLVN